MRNTILHPRALKRALTLFIVSGAVAGSMIACDSDQPSAPRPLTATSAAAPNHPGDIVRPGSGAISWPLKDATSNALITGATFTVTGPYGYSVTFTDNSAPDQDPTIGWYKLTGLLPGDYMVCQTIPPAKYLLPYGPLSPCEPVDVHSGTTTTFTGIFDMHIPIETWSATDPFGTPIGGAYFQVKDSTNTVIATFGDNSASDLNAALGKFTKEVPLQGYYTICESLAPSGFIATTPNCKKVWAPGGLIPQQVGNFTNNPTYALYFKVIDTNGKPVPSTSFTVKRQYYPNLDFVVADNVMPDRDPATGKYFIAVSAPGWYVVCQKTVPYGYDMPPHPQQCSPLGAYPTPGVPADAGTIVDIPWPVAR